MAQQPLGISFIPTEENQQLGPRRGQLEGSGGSDLAEAFKILNLHLPRVLGARSIAPKSTLTAPGSSAVGGGFDPASAVFEALIRSMTQGGASSLSSLFGS